MAKIFSSTFAAIGIIILFTLLATKGLLYPGLPPTHDGEYHVIRFYEFYKVLSDGVWYPRWAPDLNFGYGIPLFNYVYPLPNYIASFFYALGVSFIDALKLNMFVASFVGAFFMYLWSRKFWGNAGGIVSSIFYTYSPYHFLDIYVRGSVGEVWALGLFPLFLWLVTKYFSERKYILIPLISFSLALIIFSHNVLSLLFLPFALTYILLSIYQTKSKKTNDILVLFLILILALGLSSIFWLPALFERSFVRGLFVFDFSSHFVEFYQLIFPSWGTGFSADQATQGLSTQIGVANLVAFFVSLLSIRSFGKDKKNILNLLMTFWIIVTVILMLPISKTVWDTFPLLQYTQFPWRLLSLTILCCSFLAGSVTYFWKWRIVPFVLILLASLLGIGYAQPAFYHDRDDAYYLSRSNFLDGTNSPGEAFNTIWEKDIRERKKNKLEIVEGEGEIYVKTLKTAEYEFFITASTGTQLLLNTMFFPGWTVSVDGKIVDTRISPNGAIAFEVSEGEHVIGVKFLNTPIRFVGSLLSATSLITTFIIFYFRPSYFKTAFAAFFPSWAPWFKSLSWGYIWSIFTM